MDFQSERQAITVLSDIIVKSSVSLFNSTKFIYSLTDDDFYNCDIKDVFKIIFNNFYDVSPLEAMGLKINPQKCKAMSNPLYDKIMPLILYSFAARIPVLKSIKCNDDALSDAQIKAIYERVVSRGAENYNEAVSESFEENRKLLKFKKPLKPYSSEWYKTYLYNYIPALTEINNRNVFLLGAADILFKMFYSNLQDELKNRLITLDKL